jgi:eukaryotic-like serine/threonine-protein kinase
VGLVHRDLKTSNVLLAEDGPRIIDFGIAYGVDNPRLTRPGYGVGTPGYLSPEQAEGRDVGPSSDIFSLGAVLVFAATGRDPFGSGLPSALLYRVVHHEPDVEGLHSQIRSLAERCLAKNPEQRPDTRQILAELGRTRPMAGWLPAPLLQRLDAEIQGGWASASSPPACAPVPWTADDCTELLRPAAAHPARRGSGSPAGAAGTRPGSVLPG